MRLQLSAALLFCAAAGAAGIPVPTIDESLSMKSVAGAQISPDGRYVAYTVQQANWDENDFVHADLDRRDRHRRALPADQRQEILQRRRNGRPIRAASPSPPIATASARST